MKIFGLRKFIVTMTTLVFGFALALAGKLTGDFAVIAGAAVAAFNAANAWSKERDDSPE